MLPIRFHERAEREIEEARAWWLENRTKSPGAFDDNLQSVLELISSSPNAGLPLETEPSRRRVQIRRIRYWLYYESIEAAILVLALWHTSRADDPLLGRL